MTKAKPVHKANKIGVEKSSVKEPSLTQVVTLKPNVTSGALSNCS
jgi:hypothetical protein